MTDDQTKRRLGRGLAALIGEIDKPVGETTRTPAADGTVPIEFVIRNPRNPRRQFPEAELADLAQSIREHGIVQPVVVRKSGDNRYEIIAGERRWRAAQLAGLTTIPVIVREVDDRVALEIAIVENVQRSDLNPVEEALGYQKLIDDHGYTQNDLGQVIGKSRSHVANTLRLLKLPQDIQGLISDGSLSAGHARTLVNAENPASLARRIIDQGLSVRQAEALQQAPARSSGKDSAGAREKDADTLSLEKLLTDSLGMKVAVTHGAKGGELRIAYKSLEQLDELCRLLQG
ncbi:MAG: ParB/RepB/Spo0J family partition protein [Notoacmeibacter sp.]|nr:ParB/RepB/Spo0J family partition protein [Notoacmeibacter sp.]